MELYLQNLVTLDQSEEIRLDEHILPIQVGEDVKIVKIDSDGHAVWITTAKPCSYRKFPTRNGGLLLQ